MNLNKEQKSRSNHLACLFFLVIFSLPVTAQNSTCSELSYSFTDQYNLVHAFFYPGSNENGIKGDASGGAVEIGVYDSFWFGKEEFWTNGGLIWGTRIESVNATAYKSFGWPVYTFYLDKVLNTPIINYGPLLSDSRAYFEASKFKLVIQRLLAEFVFDKSAGFIPYSLKNALNNYSITVKISFGGETRLANIEAVNIPYIGVLTYNDLLEKLDRVCPTPKNVVSPAKLSFAELSESKGIRVYPNPTSGNFAIDFSLSKDAPVSFEVLDINGHSAFQMKTRFYKKGNNRVSFSLEGKLPKGIYVLTLNSVEFSETVKFFVK